MRAIFAIFIVVMVYLSLFYTDISEANTTTRKDYDKGYTKGYTDAVAEYAQENAKRDSISDIRHSQFILQMQRLTIAINEYRLATKHIKGI